MPVLMSAETWRWLGLALTAIALAGAAALIATGRACPPATRRISAPEALLWLLVLLAAADLRFRHLRTLNGGALTMDEAQAARTYVSSIVSFAPAEFGGTYLTHAWMLDAWYGLFGIGTYSPRYYTAVLALAGLVFFFATVRVLLGTRVALWSAALLAVSTYAVHFSAFAVEIGALLFWLPAVAFALVAWLRQPSTRCAAVAGLVLGLSLFTYPGVLVAYAAIALGWLAAALLDLASGRRPAELARPLAHVPARSWLALAGPMAAVLAAGAILHARVYAHTRGLFHGGGSLDLSWAGLRASLPVVLGDAFVRTGTWHLLFPDAPFVDWTYWPLAAVGAWCLWRRSPSWIGRGLVLSIPLVLLVAATCGAYPGMRRGLYVLLPVAACAGLGVDAVFARLGAWPGTFIVLLAVAHPVSYQMTIGRRTWDRAVLGQSFGARTLPDDVLLAALEEHDVVLSTDEFPNGWDRNRHLHYWRLALRHHALRHPHALLFASGGDPAGMAEVERSPDAALLTWAPERFLPSIARAGGLCFDRSRLEERPSLIRLTPPERATAQDLCLHRGGGEPALTSCVRPGYRHPLSKIVHEVACDGAYCDESRPDTVYVEPGSITFRLRPPAPPSQPVDLVVEVAVLPPWTRENRVIVNGHAVGTLERSGPDPGAELRIAIPPEARTPSEAWSITLAPGGRPGRVGWDVVWVALAPAGHRLPPVEAGAPAICPALTCVDTGQGRTCEDAAGQSRSSS